MTGHRWLVIEMKYFMFLIHSLIRLTIDVNVNEHSLYCTQALYYTYNES